MHPLWEIPEVVSEFIRLLPKKDQVQVAQVNTTLWEIAIRYIWREVPNIKNFCRLFPPNLWNKVQDTSTSPPSLNRELQDGDWSRSLLHSCHTRAIDYSIGDLRNVAPPEIWNHRLLSAAFPRLESLAVSDFDESGDPGPINIIPLLLRPSLRSVDLFTEMCTADSPVISVLQTITENKAFSLEELGFHLIWETFPVNGVVAQAIASQTYLRRLTIGGLSELADLAESAKHLPFLEQLDVQGIGWPSGAPEEKDNGLGFYSLATFVMAGHPTMIHNLLRSIGSDRLARVALTFKHWGSADLSSELIAEMRRFRPRLVHLQLNVQGWFGWEDLQPVLDLPELQSFHLVSVGVGSRDITTERVRLMIEAWPNLTQLRLHTPPSHVTLSALACIATHCPNLRKLAMTFDAGKAMNPSGLQNIDASFSNQALELFDVMATTFDAGDEEGLADVFRSWWPNARLCRSNPDPRAAVRWDIEDAFTWPGQTKSGAKLDTLVAD
ncbi:hypothetical protein FRC01_004122 [Tulasnella sp. 417]|nr:hypothetical protein FRC01_004122 [Tulasnella sp. 417]